MFLQNADVYGVVVVGCVEELVSVFSEILSLVVLLNAIAPLVKKFWESVKNVIFEDVLLDKLIKLLAFLTITTFLLF